MSQEEENSTEIMIRAQEFLKRFGYYDPIILETFGRRAEEAEEIDALTSMEVMGIASEHALKRFQEFCNLPVTGKVDQETLKWMRTPRCGVPDVARFTIFGPKWDHTNITYAFGEMTSQLKPSVVRKAIAQAFATWAKVIPLTFSLIEDLDQADIIIRFVSKEHSGCQVTLDGKGGDLAHAFPPPPASGALSGDVHFDEDEEWVVSSSVTGESPVDLVTVATHEFGHSLGLDHTGIKGRMMYPFYGGAARVLSQDDVKGVRFLYG